MAESLLELAKMRKKGAIWEPLGFGKAFRVCSGAAFLYTSVCVLEGQKGTDIDKERSGKCCACSVCASPGVNHRITE